MEQRFGGNDKIGFAGAMVFAAGGVTREDILNGTVVLTENYSGGVLTKPLILTRSPVDPLEAATKSYVDSSTNTHAENYSLHVTGDQRTLLDSLSVTAEELNALHGLTSNVDVELMRKLERSGDTMTGPFTLANDPVDALHAATKQYVDNKLAVDLTNLSDTKVNKYGDTMTGALVLWGTPQLDMHAVPKAYIDTATSALNNRLTTTESSLTVLNLDPVTKTYTNAQDALKVSKAGDVMTGPLTLSGVPVVNLHAATKGYVDGNDALRLAKAGDTMTGPLTLPSNPTQPLQAAPKQYVDAADLALSTRVTAAEGTITSLVGTAAATTYVDSQDALKLALAGGAMTGALLLATDPGVALQAATKRYVDNADTTLAARVTTSEGIVSVLNTDPVTKAYVNAADVTKLPLAGGVMTGALTLSTNPSQALHATTKQYTDAADGVLATRVTLSESALTALGTDPVTKTYTDAQDALKVAKAGDMMTGLLTLSGQPTAPMHAATKLYVDSVDNTKANKAGDTFTGPVILNADPTEAMQAATKGYVDVKLDKAGDTMTGPLVLSGEPTAPLQATTKAYVDNIDSALDLRLGATEVALIGLSSDPTSKSYVDAQVVTRLALTGGTLTGALSLASAPTLANHAATKQYVDDVNTTLDARLDTAEASLVTLKSDPVTRLTSIRLTP